MNRRLFRSHTESVLGGVAGGVAEYLDLDPAIVRVAWALLALITGGVFFVLYIVMWIVVPYPPESGEPVAGESVAPGAAGPSTWDAQVQRRHRSGSGGWIVGLIFVVLGLYLLGLEYLPDINLDRLWPLGLVLVGVALLFGALRRRSV